MAAPTLALVSVTPHALKYLYTDDGLTGGGATKTLAQLIADAKTAGPGPSPLAAYLAAQTDVSWPLAAQDTEVSFYSNILANVASGLGVNVLPQNTAPATNSLLVLAKTGTALTAIVEVRFNNTIAG
jgi:hypothetical protein